MTSPLTSLSHHPQLFHINTTDTGRDAIEDDDLIIETSSYICIIVFKEN